MKLTKSDLKLIEQTAALKSRRRKARNISLDDENYELFQERCQAEGYAPNKVLDMLILMFLEAAE